MGASDDHGNLPVLGYAGTSGYSGTDTSEERARTEDSDGTTSVRQRKTLDMLRSAGRYGRTVKEVRDLTGWHHGQASSALSNLHKAGLIARLMDRRSKSRIYVLPDYVAGRETEPYGRTRRSVDTAKVRAAISDAYYEARNAGGTMETAADNAAAAVLEVLGLA